MAMTADEFIAYMDNKRIKMGFKDDKEMLATVTNWKEVFGEEISEDYYHPRDCLILEEVIARGVN